MNRYDATPLLDVKPLSKEQDPLNPVPKSPESIIQKRRRQETQKMLELEARRKKDMNSLATKENLDNRAQRLEKEIQVFSDTVTTQRVETLRLRVRDISRQYISSNRSGDKSVPYLKMQRRLRALEEFLSAGATDIGLLVTNLGIVDEMKNLADVEKEMLAEAKRDYENFKSSQGKIEMRLKFSFLGSDLLGEIMGKDYPELIKSVFAKLPRGDKVLMGAVYKQCSGLF